MWPFQTRHKRPGPIVVVSGLPRSGTSMMMRMLDAGGMDVMTDNLRKADADNPHGYYELESVKQLKADAAFLETAHGKAVKVISLLLYDLPPDKSYKIVFMRRGLEEVLTSQRAMLQRQGKNPGPEHDECLHRTFDKHLHDVYSWLLQQPNMDTLYLDYKDVIHSPIRSARRVNAFLGNRLDVQKMAGAVDTRLYRERAGDGGLPHA